MRAFWVGLACLVSLLIGAGAMLSWLLVNQNIGMRLARERAWSLMNDPVAPVDYESHLVPRPTPEDVAKHRSVCFQMSRISGATVDELTRASLILASPVKETPDSEKLENTWRNVRLKKKLDFVLFNEDFLGVDAAITAAMRFNKRDKRVQDDLANVLGCGRRWIAPIATQPHP